MGDARLSDPPHDVLPFICAAFVIALVLMLLCVILDDSECVVTKYEEEGHYMVILENGRHIEVDYDDYKNIEVGDRYHGGGAFCLPILLFIAIEVVVVIGVSFRIPRCRRGGK